MLILTLLAGLASGEAWLRGRERAATRGAEETVWLRGYRGPRFDATRSARVDRVVVLGDDAAYGASLPDEHTWPRLLALEFARDGVGARVEVINASERDQDSARAVSLLRERVLALEPKLVVLALGAADARRPFERERKRSVLARLALWRWIAGGEGERAPLREVDVARAEFDVVRRKAVFDYGVHLAQFIELARSRHVAVVLVRPRTFVEPSRGGASPLALGASISGGEAAAALYPYLLAEFDRVAEATRAITFDAGAAPRDALPREGPAPEWTADACVEFARRLSDVLRPRLR